MSVRPKGAGAGKAALDFIEDEDGADFVAACTKGAEEFGCRGVHTAFTLDRLDDDTAGFLGYEGLELGDVVVCAVLEAGDHGRERGLVFGVWGGG